MENPTVKDIQASIAHLKACRKVYISWAKYRHAGGREHHEYGEADYFEAQVELFSKDIRLLTALVESGRI